MVILLQDMLEVVTRDMMVNEIRYVNMIFASKKRRVSTKLCRCGGEEGVVAQADEREVCGGRVGGRGCAGVGGWGGGGEVCEDEDEGGERGGEGSGREIGEKVMGGRWERR